MYLSIVEYGVFNYPPGFEGWRYCRIEYLQDDKPFAVKECHLWLPPNIDLCKLEEYLNDPP